MRYPASEKLEIIRTIEASHLPTRQTLKMLGIPSSTFYDWYARWSDGGCLTSAPSGQIWGFEQRRISGSSKPLWSEDEQEIRNIERCR